MEKIEQIPTPQPDNAIPSTTKDAGNLPVVEMEVKRFAIAGFWRRGLAIILDLAILAIPFYIWGFGFQDLAFSMGPWGRIFGYAAVFVYWGCLTSKFGKGQTLGKKIMKIVVVDRQGEYLPLGKALLRTLVFVLIGLLNGWTVPFGQNSIYQFIGSAIVTGGGLAVLYGLVFNRKTRQGIHDLIVGSFVVKVAPEPGAIAPENRRIHVWMSYGLVGLGLVWGIVNTFLLGNSSAFGVLQPGDRQQMGEIQSALMQTGEFFIVSVGRYNTQFLGTPTLSKALTIKIWVKKSCVYEPGYCDDVMTRAARLALDRFGHVNSLVGIEITVYNAFDFGIATSNNSWVSSRTIDDWRQKIAQ